DPAGLPTLGGLRVECGACGVQIGGDLGGVVGVAVVDAHPVRFALEFEAAGRPREFGESFHRDFRVVADGVGDSDSGSGVERVVPAGQGKGAVHRVPGGRVDGEHRGEPVHGDVADPVVGRVGFAVGEDFQPPLAGDLGDPARPWVVHPYHHGFGHAADECGELVVDLFQVAVVVQVVGFYVGDHGDAGRKHEEGAVAFVGLHHDDVVRARISAEPGGDQLPA